MLTSFSLKSAPTWGWIFPSWQCWGMEEIVEEKKMGKTSSWYRLGVLPLQTHLLEAAD